MSKYAVVFVAWGNEFIKQVENCIQKSTSIHQYDFILITDLDTEVEEINIKFSEVIRASFETQGHLRKSEIFKFLPERYEVYLFLDTDTLVIADISLGFKKAEEFSIALCPAPLYSMDCFWGFNRIMDSEGIPCQGQLLYNSGVIFFKNSQETRLIFKKWYELALKYKEEFDQDQPFLSLAMEKLGFNPYTLSISYNYRGFGDAISGVVRIWHSHGVLPKNINQYSGIWPPRRAWPGKVVFPDKTFSTVSRIIQKAKRIFRQRK